MEPELIADYACWVGESPLWHPGEERLYWADIPRRRLFRYDPATGQHEICFEGETGDDLVGGFTIQADGALLFMLPRGAVRTWRDGYIATLIEETPAVRHTRLKDCVADPRGRVYAGSVSTKEKLGALYRIDTDGTATEVVDGVGGSNGLGFTPDRKGMYYTDSSKGEIYLFDYDEESGEIANRRVWCKIPASEGVPDGMTVDAEGYIWSARWGGGCVVRYAPDGSEDLRIRFPAKKVSSCTFGGCDYRDLYVTTAGGRNKADEGPGAGGLFRVVPGVQGVPEFLSRVGM